MGFRVNFALLCFFVWTGTHTKCHSGVWIVTKEPSVRDPSRLQTLKFGHMWDMPLEGSREGGSGGTSAVSTHLTPQVPSLLLTKRGENLVSSQSSALTSRTLPGLSLLWRVGSLPLTTWP